MMLAALLLQTSLLVAPMYLGDEPPEARSVRTIVVVHRDVEGAAKLVQRSREEAQALAGEVALELRAGADFDALAREHSGRGDSGQGAVLGTFWPGMLAPELDGFLFSAELGATSDPLETPGGFHVLQRIDRLAGCLAILIDAEREDGEARARELCKRLRQGADFAALAREHSDDAQSAARGGQLAVFERGASDRLVKAAAFALAVGEVSEPLRTPLGWHVLKRVEPASIASELHENSVIRARLILVTFDGARGSHPRLERTHQAAYELARELVERVRAGEDMAEHARQHDDDRGGRERAGDLGWLRRKSPQTPEFLDRVFLAGVGEVLDPIPSEWGWLVLRRER
jgi:parvulin-like peptidyl-prolyl isomerase